MKLLLNDKEIAGFLYKFVGYNISALHSYRLKTDHMDSVKFYIHREISKRSFNLEKKRHKIKQKIKRAVEKDLNNWRKQVIAEIKSQKEQRFNLTHRHLNYFIEKLGEEKILEMYLKCSDKNFVKSTGLFIDPKATLTRRRYYTDPKENCLLRNTVGNEHILVDKIDNNYPFWFIDSGYTNFLETNKKWHRLVPNHLHWGDYVEVPVDRLSMFAKFPQPWRTGGDRILIIEPGQFAANIFHVDIKTWKYNIEQELRQYTDKKIIFREKSPKKQRAPLYKHLLDEDYHCVININSNAATEAVWAGIPIITLDKHITNPIARRKISDVENLYRPHLAQWLCMLSYSQFTYDELINGQAVSIVKKYYA